MATVRIITAITLDGYLPKGDTMLMLWVTADAKGFPYWHNRSTFQLYNDYPILDLICGKCNSDKTCIYTAEISQIEHLELLTKLSRYHTIDELIIYILPEIYGSGNRVFPENISSEWVLHKSNHYKNGICRNIYRHRVQ